MLGPSMFAWIALCAIAGSGMLWAGFLTMAGIDDAFRDETRRHRRRRSTTGATVKDVLVRGRLMRVVYTYNPDRAPTPYETSAEWQRIEDPKADAEYRERLLRTGMPIFYDATDPSNASTTKEAPVRSVHPGVYGLHAVGGGLLLIAVGLIAARVRYGRNPARNQYLTHMSRGERIAWLVVALLGFGAGIAGGVWILVSDGNALAAARAEQRQRTASVPGVVTAAPEMMANDGYCVVAVRWKDPTTHEDREGAFEVPFTEAQRSSILDAYKTSAEVRIYYDASKPGRKTLIAPDAEPFAPRTRTPIAAAGIGHGVAFLLACIVVWILHKYEFSNLHVMTKVIKAYGRSNPAATSGPKPSVYAVDSNADVPEAAPFRRVSRRTTAAPFDTMPR